jgi:hypothetical protein
MSNNIKFEIESWQSELTNMVATADESDKLALEAFSKAMTPYFNEPMMLRSILGKIQAPILGAAVQQSLDAGSFSSVEEIVALLPSDVHVRVEAQA